MPRVLCTLPNAADTISGVKFEPHERGVASVEISDADAEFFASITGYELLEDEALAPTPGKQTAKSPAKAATRASKSPTAPSAPLDEADDFSPKKANGKDGDDDDAPPDDNGVF